MNCKAIAIIASVLAILCIVPSAVDGDAGIESNPDSIVFDNMNGGTISFQMWNDEYRDVTITVEVREGRNVVKETDAVLAASTDEESRKVTTVNVEMRDFKSVGSHVLTVTVTSDDTGIDPYTFNVNVNVEKNLLSNWTTYAVIAIAVIVIAVLVYLKIRDTPKEKNTMTFEELEAQRKAEAAQKSEQKAAGKKAASTERKRYSGKK